jgi:hypothetical protein
MCTRFLTALGSGTGTNTIVGGTMPARMAAAFCSSPAISTAVSP